MVFAITIHNYEEKSLRGSLGDRGNLYKKDLFRWPLSSSVMSCLICRNKYAKILLFSISDRRSGNESVSGYAYG